MRKRACGRSVASADRSGSPPPRKLQGAAGTAALGFRRQAISMRACCSAILRRSNTRRNSRSSPLWRYAMRLLQKLQRSPQIAFKWPNDLLLAGNKCAGILIEGEAALDGEEAQAPKRLTVIVGIGANCTSHPPRSNGTDAFPATDLQAHGAEITPAPLFRRLSATMCRRLAQWDRSHGFATILADWLSHARGIGEQITVRNNGVAAQGRFVGLDQAGRLLLELRDGTLTTISAGDVFPLAVHGPRRIAERPG
jgi:biotin-(acetyl-CoA carboxylase) ligase